MGHKERSIKNQIAQQRINIICGGIKEGIPYEEIEQRLQFIPEIRNDAVSNISVVNVKRVIKTLPFIEEIIESKPNSYEDAVKKHDLTVFLNGDNVNSVGIQIKSSIQYVLNFYQKFSINYSIAKEILIKKKIIVLNGQLPDEIIENFFLSQLNLINQYHQELPSLKLK
ncbi:MAG: hypothetical protein PHP97_00960 [Candidatus Shapirobacteria bacterium]|nr:hypothetical protein [Candidatus Shapirobacteria bacterium]MDD3002500.1 hypothetical protein [Candidatus Shapirobacteria bacterium]MDD4383405.1 hypothetical protein [Candidatus Shapirobacteria bacterium]